MGLAWCHPGELSANPYVLKVSSTESITPSDPFWHEMLSFSAPVSFSKEKMLQMEKELQSLLEKFRQNNLRSHNLTALLQVLIAEVTNILGSVKQSSHLGKTQLLRTCNTFFTFRLITKYLMENMPERNFLRHFEGVSPESPSSLHLMDYIFQLIFSIITDLPTSEETYPLLCEAISTALQLLGRQMHCYIYSTPLMFQQLVTGKNASRAPYLIHRLLLNFAENRPCPPGILCDNVKSSGILWRTASSLASGLVTVVTLGFARPGRNTSEATTTPAVSINGPSSSNSVNGDKTQLITSESTATTEQESQLLGNLSCLLLLVLTAKCGLSVSAGDVGEAQDKVIVNPYREALFSMRNELTSESSEVETDATASTSSNTSSVRPQLGSACSVTTINSMPEPLRINFETVCNVAASTLGQGSTTLLLYLLLHSNIAFKQYLLQKENYRKLLLPLLSTLYRLPEDNSPLVYMNIIILLILTEQENFAREIHTMNLKYVSWVGNRQLYDISLGSLLILVLIRTVQHHLNQLKDKYLHVNILASLANLSSYVSDLHPHVGETFVGLLHLLAKRHARTVEQIRLNAVAEKEKGTTPVLDVSGVSIATGDTTGLQKGQLGGPKLPNVAEEFWLQELTLLEEVIRMLLEIVNSSLTHSMSTNSNLIYALLYKRDSFSSLRTHPSFQNVMQNIDTVLTFFTKRIEKHLGEQPTHPGAVMTVIHDHAPTFRRHCNLKKFPDMKFKYVEEESPDDFFIPYVWSVVLRQSCIPFRSTSLPLFSSNTSTAPSTVDEGTEGEHHSAEDTNISLVV